MAALQTAADKTTNVPSIVNSISDTTQPAANKTAGAALEGVSNLFDETVKAESGREDRDMGNKAYDKVDAYRKDLGIDDAALNSRMGLPVKGAIKDNENDFSVDPNAGADGTGAGNPLDANARMLGSPGQADSPPLPPQADNMINRAERMTRAVRQGSLGNTEYSAGLEAIVRQLRAEYPGSRDEIDQKISQITGQTPANALRASMLRDQITAERASRSQASFEQNYHKLNDKYAPDLADAPFAVFRHAVIQAQAQEHQVTMATASLNLDEKIGQSKGIQAAKVLTQSSTIDTDQIITRFGTGIQKLADQKEPLTNKQIEEARPQMNILRAEVDKRFEQRLDQPVDFDPAHPEMRGHGPTLRSIINDPNKVAAMKTANRAQVDDLEARMTNGEWGNFNFNANSAKASVAAADSGLMRNEHLAILASVQTRFGPNVANLVVGDNENGTAVLPLLQKTILQAGKLQLATKGGDDLSATAAKAEAAAQKPNQPPVTASMYKEQMAGTVRLMTGKDIPDEVKAEAVSKVVNDAKYLYKFNAGYGQVQAFTTLYSPEVSKSVKELSVPDPKIWNEYKGAAIRNFVGVYKAEADTAQSVNKVEGYHTVFSPDSNQFDVVADKGRGPIEDDARKANLEVYKGRVADLNRGMRTLTEVLKLDKQDVGSQLLQISKAIGINPNVPKEGFWAGVSDAVGKTVKGVGTAVENAVTPNVKG